MNARVVGATVGAIIVALPLLALAQDTPPVPPPEPPTAAPGETAPPDEPVPADDALIPPKARDTPVEYPEGATGGAEVVLEITVNVEGKVTAAVVDHPPIRPAFAYRFDTPDRSLVISGDTAPSPALVELAKGADVLVHEVLYLPAVERMAGNEPQAKRLREHLVASHTPSGELGRIAAQAGVKTLVLSHFVPGDDPSITDAMWTAGVRDHFKGKVVVGRDLMVL